ncbi:efflux RND transporter periplasmic adaptor subunit [Limnohabitans lacus]|jgi:cobalt-zinc-cadmium efflux system membrane fusion protein|uniref:Efflux RND transporter periplasmic adaptor subunit n=1 Tax=Limnohabitans lacus TaxID=3045173 RepID=A0ABT6XAL8_9BURK|nr:efflux RND transporter periplasmic adaptor subunit [Limnohabitans sp. HM2-2]MDI9235126.1 efflux RND transporter periplasmic adaptor subunit [Limnohabitans sp. HM2-2]
MKINTKKLNISKKHLIAIAVIVLTGILLGSAILGGKATKTAENDGDGHGSHAEAKATGDGENHEAPTKGPHGGKLFKEGDFGLEALLAEEGGEPRLRIWLYEKSNPLPTNAAKVGATISRLTGEKQTLNFTSDKDSLLSREVVPEPHAFEISIAAQTANKPFIFVLNQEEGKVELSDAQIKAASIGIDTAGAALIKSALLLPGEIRLNEDRTSHVVPRISGAVESVQASLGQAVKKGQVLAVIASPAASEQRSELQTAQKRLTLAKTTFEREKRLWEQKISAEQDYLQAGQALHEAEVAVTNAQQKLSALGLSSSSQGGLNRFELRAPFDGLVIEKHLSLGEAVKEDAAVFTVSDLGQVWAEINVPAKDLPLVKVGEKVAIKATAFDASALGTITFVGSLIGEQTRMAKARVVLANPKGAWRPGLFVNVEVTSSEAEVPVTVASDAIQTVGDKSVVFLKVDGGFVAQPVQLGRSDGKRVEVVQGIRSGAPYASTGSFVVKSELGKASAEHAH